MKLKSTIEINDKDPKKLIECFKPEMTDDKRSNFKLKEKENSVLFEIESKDSVALRATLNSITKLLTVYEKMEKL